MLLCERLLAGNEILSVIGLGYVGISTAVAFSKKVKVIGFDLDREKISLYKNGIDSTFSLGDDKIKECSVEFTFDSTMLKKAKFHIIAVPTPIDEHNAPMVTLLENACELLGKNLSKGSVVVIESTVYPGMTEEVCIPILEKTSGLKSGVDFKVGYSPERINPGDKINRFENITKIVSGMDEEALEEIATAYGFVIEAGVYKAPSIRVAEAAKMVENAQRDINIAFVNELSLIFDKMGIDTKSVLDAAGTKWNFLKFSPGLVGGQCIGVDPYYLIHIAKRYGYESKVISAGREINDFMGKFVALKLLESLRAVGKSYSCSKIAVFGFAFKENFSDIRNTKVWDIIEELKKNKAEVCVCDPLVNKGEADEQYGISLCEENEIENVDAVVFSVAHDEFKKYKSCDLNSFFKDGKKIIFDVKGIFSASKEELEKDGFVYLSL